MPDYSEWLRRADVFVRATSALPGRWSMNIEIEPPADAAELDRLEDLLPHGLPPVLRDLYGTASAAAGCQFRWSPDKAPLAEMDRILPSQYTVYGGPHFCSAGDLAEHQESLTGWADVFDDFGGFGPATAQTLRESVPLVNVGNGDYVVFHTKANRGEASVVYVSHEAAAGIESPLIPLAESGEQFMTEWESLGYLGPEIWLLYRFIEDSPTGLLDHNSPLAMRWRSFLNSLGLPI